MTERLHEGQLVGMVLKESEARLVLQKIKLARVRNLGKHLIYQPSGDTREYLYSSNEKGIQLVIPELSGILDAK